MVDEAAGFRESRTVFDVLACLLGLFLLATWTLTANDALLIVASYTFLLGTSTTVVTFGLVQFTGTRVGSSETDGKRTALGYFTGYALETESDAERDTGWLIGRLENVIVLSLVFASAFTALSIVFAAKSFVRREDIASEDTAYYLAGTLLNFTYSIVTGFVVLETIHESPVV